MGLEMSWRNHLILFLLFVSIACIVGFSVPEDYIRWRLIDISTVVLGSIGIISSVGEARRVIIENSTEMLGKGPGSWLRTITSVRNSYREICEMRIRQGQSPEGKEEYAKFQNWLSDLPSYINSEHTNLNDWLQSCPKDIQDRELHDFKHHLTEIAAKYGLSRDSYEQEKAGLKRTPIEQLVLITAPFLISLSLSLAFFSATFKPGP